MLNQQRRDNRLVRGILVMHGIHRDIEWAVDGDAALQMMAAFHSDSHAYYWSDNLDPLTSTAESRWIVWNPQQFTAAQWNPERTLTRAAVLQDLVRRGISIDEAESLLEPIRARPTSASATGREAEQPESEMAGTTVEDDDAAAAGEATAEDGRA